MRLFWCIYRRGEIIKKDYENGERESERNEWCGGKSRVVLMAGRQPTNVYCLCIILTILASVISEHSPLSHIPHLLSSSLFHLTKCPYHFVTK